MSSTAAVNDHHLDRIAVEAQADLTVVRGGAHRAQDRAEAARKSTPFALHAIGGHMVDRLVANPWSIDVTPEQVRVYVDAEERQAWLESVHVDAHDSIPSSAPGYVLHRADGRLPDTGVRVRIISSHRVDEDVDLYVGEARS